MAQVGAGGVEYLLTDALGSVRGIADEAGTLAGSAAYGVFGDYRSQSGLSSKLGFTGEYFAQELGTWHLRARDMMPGLGRFLSADSVQPNAPGTQGFNVYAYAANNPTTWADPSGHAVGVGSLSLLGLSLSSLFYWFAIFFLLLVFLILFLKWAEGGGLDDLLEDISDIPDTIDELLDNLGDPPPNPEDDPAEDLPPVPEEVPKPLPPCSLPGSGVPYLDCWPDDTDEVDDPNCAPDVNYLIARAETYRNALLPSEPIAYKQRNVAVLRVKESNGTCVDYVGSSGSRTLTPSQRALKNPQERFATQYRDYAEITVMDSAWTLFNGYFIALGVSHDICSTCRSTIMSRGGAIISPQGAIWLQN